MCVCIRQKTQCVRATGTQMFSSTAEISKIPPRFTLPRQQPKYPEHLEIDLF